MKRKKHELARIVDPQALDRQAGARGKVRVIVPEEWLDERAELIVTVPARVCCARCDGGGCDSCNRSGAVRLVERAEPPGPKEHVTVELLGDGRPATFRLVHPFGAGGLAQLLVEVVPGEQASANVTYGRRRDVHHPRSFVSTRQLALIALIALAAAVYLVWRALR